MIFKLKIDMDSVIPKLLIDGHAIVRVQLTDFLSILLNISQTWTHHIKSIKQNTMGLLKYIKNKLSTLFRVC